MARWLLGILGGLLVLCLGCAAVGYLRVKPHMHSTVTNAMAIALTDSISNRIEHDGLVGDRLVLREEDLNINNDVRPGEWGIEVTTTDATIYGILIAIERSSLVMLVPGTTITGTPVLERGHIALTAVISQGPRPFVFVSSADFEAAIERGINDALASYGLIPVGIELSPGSMSIQLRRLDGQPFATFESASPTPVTTARWVD